MPDSLKIAFVEDVDGTTVIGCANAEAKSARLVFAGTVC